MAAGTKVADVYADMSLDLTNYRKGLATAKTESLSLVSQMKDAFNKTWGPTGAMSARGIPIVQELTLGQRAMAALTVGAKGLGNELKGLSVSALHAGLNGVKTVLGSLGSLASQVGKGLLLGLGVGVGMGLVQVVAKLAQTIPDLINKGKEYGQQVADVIHATGATGEAASKFVSTINFLNGGPVNNLNQLIAQFARNVAGAGANLTKSEKDLMGFGTSLKFTGTAVYDQNGVLLSNIDLLDKVRSSLSKVADQNEKLAIVQQMVGRGGAKVLLDYFRLTDEQANKLAADFQAQGLIITTAQAQLAENTNRELNRLGNSWSGLANQLFNDVGPTINAFITMISNWLTQNAQAIATTVSNVVSSILGFVAGLTGANMSIGAFTSSLTDQTPKVTAAAEGVIQAKNALDTYDAAQKTAKASTGASTAATDAFTKAKAAETAAVDKQITALKALDTQQDKTYKNGLTGLNAQLDAQMKLMSAQDQANQRVATAADLQRSLRDSQEALTKAQLDAQDAIAKAEADKTLSPLQRAQAELDAANSVRNAEEALAQVRQSIADNARTMAEDDRKAQIQNVKDYITAVDQIVSDAGLAGGSSKTALADLEKRRKALTVGGTPAAGSDQAIQLAAVLAAETRVRQQSANTAKQTALDLAKTEISAAKQAAAGVTAAAASVTDAKRAALATQLADAQATFDAEVAAAKRAATLTGVEGKRAGKAYTTVFGTDGVVQKAFTDFQTMGVNAAKAIHDAFVGSDEKGGLLGALNSIGGAVGSLSTALGTIPNIPAGGRLALGAAIAAFGASHGNLFLVTSGLTIAGMAASDVGNAVANDLPQVQNSHVEQDAYTAYMTSQLAAGKPVLPYSEWAKGYRSGSAGGGTWSPGATGKASGGAVWPNNVYRINEGSPVEGLFSPIYPNVVVPVPAMPAFAAGGGGAGGSPAIIRLEIGGTKLLDYIDQHLAYRRLRRT